VKIVGSFRFHDEYALAVRLIDERRLDLTPLLTGSFDIADAQHAFDAANDRRTAMKVQLLFS
jgi:L-idonate 5-dehydrogenase